jgi:exosome complex component RRP41
MGEKPDKFIIDGKRLDGRAVDEMRPVKMEVGTLKRANGSCSIEFGGNIIVAGVFGPREVHPRHLQEPVRAIVRYRYNMASFSVEDRKRPGPDRRSTAISKVSQAALESVVMTEAYPKSAIDIFVEILQADAGSRVAALNAASVALADAGVPMRGLISSCAVGKVDDTIVLDLGKDEDNYGQADLPVAMTSNGEITLLQMDGNMSPKELDQALDMAIGGCKQIYEIQREALTSKYSGEPEEPVEAEEI